MADLVARMAVLQIGKCCIYGAKFTDPSDIAPGYIHPRRIGKAWQDDHPADVRAFPLWRNA